MRSGPYEIERKFLICYPDPKLLASAAERSEIVQTYLLGEKGSTERVRMRTFADHCEYSHTVKRRISDMRRVEEEREITREEYERLLSQADPACRTIRKTRYCLPYEGKMLEIDVFPFWDDRAYLEVELQEEGESVALPESVHVIRELTGDRRYTNAALAREIPFEEI